MKLIAVTGGIGSGKSVVSEILRIKGFPVFDCDMEAKRLMDGDCEMHQKLCHFIHPRAVVEGRVNRPLISQLVFGDEKLLNVLNNIVHARVKDELSEWARDLEEKGCEKAFVETAIARSSGLIEIVDAEWHVTAPLETRIERVKRRSGLSDEQIQARINAQSTEYPSEEYPGDSLIEIQHKNKIRCFFIDNSSDKAIIPQINHLLKAGSKILSNL